MKMAFAQVHKNKMDNREYFAGIDDNLITKLGKP